MSDLTHDFTYDLAVIGGGPGGYVAAIRAAQRGLKTVVVEKDKLGGVCGNWGCIPSKSLIHQADAFRSIALLEQFGVKIDVAGFDYAKVQAKSRVAADGSAKGTAYLLKKNKVDVVVGTATLTGPNQVSVAGAAPQTLTAAHVLVATGSRPRVLPGFEFDETTVLSSNGILALTTLPKSLVILGSGAIGMEFAYILNAFGVAVTVVEALPRVLPNEDKDTAAVVEKAFTKRGVVFHAGTKAVSLAKTASGVEVTVEKDGKADVLKADKILVAVGRVPNTEGLGLEALGVGVDRGFVTVGDYYQTSAPSVYAVGDVVASPLLAHVASKEGEIAVERIAHLVKGTPAPAEKRLDPTAIPGVTYCDPQVASFGLTEEAARGGDVAYQAFSFPFVGNGKAKAVDKTEGLVKVLVDPTTLEILGAHVAGLDASEVIHELLLAKHAQLTPDDIATMVHAHPTVSEAVMEAAKGLAGRAIHI